MLKRSGQEHSEADQMTLVDHLAELRRRIMIVIATLVVGVLAGFFYSPSIVDYLMRLPGELVYLYPGEAFFVHLTVALAVGIVLGFPIILYQIIRFLLPGLLTREIRILYLGLPFAIVLFLVGVVFAYQVILPLAYTFFMGFGTERLTPLISIGNYVSFVLGLVLPFGAVFQLPLIVLLLTGAGILNPRTLTHYRKYVILVIFVLAALLTPPDIVSQVLMTLPMVLLYEFSIVLSRLIWRKRVGERL